MKKQSGSALLLVILITSALTVLAFTSWYKSSLLFDLVVQREKYYKNFYMTEAVLNHGLSVIKKQFDAYKKQHVINLKSLVQNELNEPEKGAQLVVLPSVQTLHHKLGSNSNLLAPKAGFERLSVSAVLYDNKSKKSLCSLSCMLVKNENKFFIQNFTCEATCPAKL